MHVVIKCYGVLLFLFIILHHIAEKMKLYDYYNKNISYVLQSFMICIQNTNESYKKYIYVYTNSSVLVVYYPHPMAIQSLFQQQQMLSNIQQFPFIHKGGKERLTQNIHDTFRL